MTSGVAATIALVAIGLAVPALALLRNRWMYGDDLNLRRILTGSLVIAPIFAVIGAFVAGFASDALGGSTGLVLGLVVGLGLFGLLMRGGGSARRVTLLAERLRDDEDRDATVSALRRELERALKRKDMLLATQIVNELSAAGRWADAVDPAERALATEPDAYLAEMLRLTICVGSLYLGRDERAAEVRATLAETDVAEIHEWVVASLDALRDAFGGAPEAALAATSDEPIEDSVSQERTRLAIRAHAFAALGRDDEAMKALEALRALVGDPYLEEHAALDRPASPLARQLLLGERGPYRG